MKMETEYKIDKRIYRMKENSEDDCRDLYHIIKDSHSETSRLMAKLYKVDFSEYFVLNVLRKKGNDIFSSRISDKPILVLRTPNWKIAEEESCEYLDYLLFKNK